MIDLSQYIKGNGEVYRTKNSWTSDEIMQTQFGANGIFYQCKGPNWEEMAVTANTIVRGLDTSPGGGLVYTLAGSVWSPRWMAVGDSFTRIAPVTFMNMETGKVSTSYTDRTTLKLVALHPSWTSYGGLAIPNVIELEGYTSAGALFERYFYGENLGLVGWRGGTAMAMQMGISSRPGNLPALKRMELPWYAGLKVESEMTVLPNDPRWKDYTLRTTDDDKPSNMRNKPTTIGSTVLKKLEPKIDHTVQWIEAETINDGKYYWYLLKVDGLIGWARNDVVVIIPVATPPVLSPVERKVLMDAVAGVKAALQVMYTHMYVLESYLKEVPTHE